jgi:hypothetical protein
MLARQWFKVRPKARGRLDLSLPIEVELGAETTAVLREGKEDYLTLTLDRRIDPSKVRLEAHSGHKVRLADGSHADVPALRVPDNSNVGAIDVTAAITFLTDVPLAASHGERMGQMVAEDETDRAVIEAWETHHVFLPTTALPQMRSVDVEVDSEAIESLLPKTVGLRLYADAISLDADVAAYRELWRVLESAFGLQDKDLVDALADYPEARALDFDHAELQSLSVLRGRISHAGSKGGLTELLKVGGEASNRIARLKNLVERVIITKASWGSKGGGVKDAPPIGGYIDVDGRPVVKVSSE